MTAPLVVRDPANPADAMRSRAGDYGDAAGMHWCTIEGNAPAK